MTDATALLDKLDVYVLELRAANFPKTADHIGAIVEALRSCVPQCRTPGTIEVCEICHCDDVTSTCMAQDCPVRPLPLPPSHPPTGGEVKTQPARAFAIVDLCDGYIWTSYIRYLRRDTIAAWIKDTEKTWKEWQRDGKACVRVEVRVVNK